MRPQGWYLLGAQLNCNSKAMSIQRFPGGMINTVKIAVSSKPQKLVEPSSAFRC
jgi:hypothetical protein